MSSATQNLPCGDVCCACHKLQTHKRIPLLRVRVARNSAEIDALRSPWESIEREQGTIFQTFRWNRIAVSMFADREEPHFLFCEDDNGMAIIPAVIRRETMTLSFAGESLFDYRDY